MTGLFYFQLFWSFFKIGAFTLGGGYAMIPLIEQEVTGRRRWLGADEFAEALALAQSSPGPVSINLATFTGYRTRGLAGALAATLGTVLPSFAAILAIVIFFSGYRENAVIQRIFCGLRPAVAALIAVPAINMLKRKKFAPGTVLTAGVAAAAVAWLKVSPALVMAAAAAAGAIGYMIRRSKNKKDGNIL